MLEKLREIDSIRLNFDSDGFLLMNFAIAFIMFGVALELKFSDFRKLFHQPKPALVGILSQFLLMPLLTFLFVIALKSVITPTVGLGMILVAACPGGNISNFISNLAKGNIALSVSLTAFSSLGGIILTPLSFTLWGNLYIGTLNEISSNAMVRNLEIDGLNVLITILMVLGLPLIFGVLFNTKFPELTQKLVGVIKRLSILIFIAMVGIIFSKNIDYFLQYIIYIFFIVLVHNAMALATGYYTAKLAGLDLTDRRTISIETGIQNSGLAMVLLFNPAIFPKDLPIGGMAFIAAWWGVWHIIAGLSIASVWSEFSLKR